MHACCIACANIVLRAYSPVNEANGKFAAAAHADTVKLDLECIWQASLRNVVSEEVEEARECVGHAIWKCNSCA